MRVTASRKTSRPFITTFFVIAALSAFEGEWRPGAAASSPRISACVPSVPAVKPRISAAPSPPPMTAAPAASPKRTQVARSFQSINLVREFDPDKETLRSPVMGSRTGDVEAEDEAGATAAGEVEGWDLARTETVLEVRRGVGNEDLRRVGGDDDFVDLVDRHIGIRERALGGGCGEVDGGLIIGRDSPGLDPGAGGDPLVGGVHMLGPLVVGHHPVGHVGAKSENARCGFSGMSVAPSAGSGYAFSRLNSAVSNQNPVPETMSISA